jgi:hypothetical protein
MMMMTMMIFNSGTQKLHTFLPDRNGVLLQKSSASSESTEYNMSDLKDSMQLKNITGFVMCAYDSSWQSGCVPSTDENKVKLLSLNSKLQHHFHSLFMARHTKYSLHSTSNESVYKHCNGAYIYNE